MLPEKEKEFFLGQTRQGKYVYGLPAALCHHGKGQYQLGLTLLVQILGCHSHA